jgi:hypothetical protein
MAAQRTIETQNPAVGDIPIADALDNPLFRLQMQALKDMTAAICLKATSPVIFSTDPGAVHHKRALATP